MGRKDKRRSSSSSSSESSSSSQSSESDNKSKKSKKGKQHLLRESNTQQQFHQPRRARQNGLRRQNTFLRPQNLDDGDDYNLRNGGSRGFEGTEKLNNDQPAITNGFQRRQTVVRQNTMKMKTLVQNAIAKENQQRNIERAKTIVMAEVKVNNLQNELQNEKEEKEELQRAREQAENETKFQVSHLQNEKQVLIRQAEKKKSYIENIQNKLQEEKVNRFDISTAQSAKKPSNQFGFSFVNTITNLLYNKYLLSVLAYKIFNSFDAKVYEHFAFLACMFNLSLLGSLVFLEVYLRQLISSTTRADGIGLTFTFSFAPEATDLAFILLAFLLAHALILFHKYNRQKVRSVREQARQSSNIVFFKLALSSYNWKISNRTQLEKMQLALFKRGNDLLYNHQRVAAQKITIQIMIYRFIGILLWATILFFQLLGVKYLEEKTDDYVSNYFIAQSIRSAICSFICLLGSNIIHFMGGSEQYYGTFFKLIRIFSLQILPCAYMIGTQTLILYETTYSLPSLFHSVRFINERFSCPNEQLGYVLVILMLAYALSSLVFSYITIIFFTITQKCSNQNDKLYAQPAIVAKYFFHLPFRCNEQTSAYFVVYFIAICAIPFNPFVLPLVAAVILVIFFHNFLQAKVFYTPQLDSLSQTKVKGINGMFFSLSLFLATVYIMVLYGTDYDLGSFVYKGKVFNCGPFERNQIALDIIQNSLGGFSNFIDVILWKPVIVCVLILAILLAWSFYYQMREWQNQYKGKDKELRAIKRFYSREVYNLEDKITYAQRNITNLVKTDYENQKLQEYKTAQAANNNMSQSQRINQRSNTLLITNPSQSNNNPLMNSQTNIGSILNINGTPNNSQTVLNIDKLPPPKLRSINPTFLQNTPQSNRNIANSNLYSNAPSNAQTQHELRTPSRIAPSVLNSNPNRNVFASSPQPLLQQNGSSNQRDYTKKI